MRRLFGWMAGLASVAALAKLYQRWRHDARRAETPGPELDPAEELRRKLDEVRGTGPTDVGSAPSPDAAGEATQEATLEERRAAIHAKAQEAIDAMKADDA